jgi:NDP-sugar pyrophosphorylase family protein
MAGGFGKRLLPLTQNTPKPMLPIGEQPLMERMIGQLRDAGIHRVNVTTHFEPEKIRDYFGDGERFGVNLNYVSEERPLGTAGALRLIETKKEPLLIINGDILTRVDFRAMLDFHREHQADLTVGVREYDFQVPYGVIETEGARVTGVNEKPVYKFFVNAGIYLLQPALDEFIPKDERFDMTDLIEKLIAAGRTVASFPIMEYWLDIGRLADYERAQEDVKNWETNK